MLERLSMPELMLVVQGLVISRIALRSLELPLVSSVGGMVIEFNDSLTAIDMAMLIGQGLNITRNAMLPACEAFALRDQLVASGSSIGTVMISENASETCP
jgi:hypothetical protein